MTGFQEIVGKMQTEKVKTIDPTVAPIVIIYCMNTNC